MINIDLIVPGMNVIIVITTKTIAQAIRRLNYSRLQENIIY